MQPVMGAPVASSLKDELIARGYAYSEWKLGGQSFREFQAANGWKWITRTSFYDYPFIPFAVRMISKDKPLSNEIAARHSVNLPESIATRDISVASEFLARHGRVVVKPADRSGGEGLTTDVTDVANLTLALERATYDDMDPLVQRQVNGDEVRFTIINGRVVSALLRQTPRLVGDGRRSINELLAAENEIRTSLVFPTLSYPQLDSELPKSLGVDGTDILADGTVLELSRSTMIRGGASFIGVLNEIHHSYITIAEDLAADLHPQLLIVDLIIQDITHPADEVNYVFLEFNTAPSTRIYSSVRGGDTPDVIRMLADLIDDYSSRMNR